MKVRTERKFGIHICTQYKPTLDTFITEHWYVEFENGYAASIIKGSATFELYEVAVCHGDYLCYATSITNDVLHCNEDAVSLILDKIAQLPFNNSCTHEHIPSSSSVS